MAIKLQSNFETPERLIGYCEIHCETPRALFNGDQINDMLMLAGYPEGFVTSVQSDLWQSVHEPMNELCKLARGRLSEH